MPHDAAHHSTPTCNHCDSHFIFSASYAPNLDGQVVIDHTNQNHVCIPRHHVPLPPSTLNTPLRFSQSTTFTSLHNSYPYTGDLLALASISKATSRPQQTSIPGISSISTPLFLSAWVQALQAYPDNDLREYILTGIQEGFYLGFNHRQQLSPAKANMSSAMAHQSPVDKYLSQECTAGRVLGPLPPSTAQNIHTNRFGVIPKKRQPGKWRLILDLSFPPGQSVNDGISKDSCSLQFTTVDDAARLIAQLGRGTLLAKIDIAQAYRNVPVHPSECHLLGMSWKGSIFIDTALPFGLRSAPKIFCAISDTLEWVLLQEGITNSLHYIDDFLTAGSPASAECSRNLTILRATCERLGVPLAAEKVEGPTTELTFLGIELNTQHMVMRLPQIKLTHLQQVIRRWTTKRAATKREMLSLIGELAHACRVVRPGRTFLRRMIDVAHSRPRLHHWIRINNDFKSDLLWWHCFLEDWNGVALLSTHSSKPPSIEVFSDASGSWGCSALWGSSWFQAPWSADWSQVNIATKELVPVVLAFGIWGPLWSYKHVLVRSDNMAVVEIIRARTSRDSLIMHLLRCLHFLCALHSIHVTASHIPGVENTPADALSRDDLHLFFLSHPKAAELPTPVPPQLWDLVVASRPDWTCHSWRAKLRSSCRAA